MTTLPGKPAEQAIAEKEAEWDRAIPKTTHGGQIRACVDSLNKFIQAAEKSGCEVRLSVVEFDNRTTDDASVATRTGARLEVRVLREE
jgi:hypothetical protein